MTGLTSARDNEPSRSDAPTPVQASDVLDVVHLSKTYGTGPKAVHAVKDLTFTVQTGEIVCIVGPSGCGKTTLLKCLSGLMRPTGGSAIFDGAPIVDTPDGLALVFQDYTRSLLPWMTVLDNVMLPLRKRGSNKVATREAALEALSTVGLSSFVDSYPWQLSGGMQQRVAIARALAYKPKILVMDEPFASVDAQTRADLEDLILTVQSESDVTVLLVTHDIDEAVYLADRVVVLSSPPTTVTEVIEVPLSRPRDQVTTKELPAFAHTRSHILRRIRRGLPESSATTAGIQG